MAVTVINLKLVRLDCLRFEVAVDPLDFDNLNLNRVGLLAEALGTAPTVIWRRHPCLANVFPVKAFKLVALIAQHHLVRASIEVTVPAALASAHWHLTPCV